MAALAILRAIRDQIDTTVNATTFIVQDAKPGDQGIWVQRADQYLPGETIVLKNNEQAEMHTVLCTKEVSGNPVLVLCEDVTAPFLVDGISWVQKTFGNQIVEEITIGNPDHLDNYPAITIEAKTIDREPLTLSSVSDMFTYEIGVWNDATTYADAYEVLLQITDKTKDALFRDFYPLAEPFFATVLAQETKATDTTIQVASNEHFTLGAWLWFDNRLGIKRHNRVAEKLANDAIRLAFPIGFAFKLGDPVIRPRVNLYDPRIENVTFDDAVDQDHLLKSSTITYTIKLEFIRPMA